MDNIFIIGRNDNAYLKSLGLEIVTLPIISSDEEITNFIERNLVSLNFDRLIIPLSGQDVQLGLRVALHIRLTKLPLYKNLCPILFISEQQLESIIKESGMYGQILFSKGCEFEGYNSKNIILTAASLVNKLEIHDYRLNFLNLINVIQDEKDGRHSLANQWGAISLAEAANVNLNTYTKLSNVQSQLYFKFINAKKNIDRSSANGNSNVDYIHIGNQKILLIDDEADKGWEDILNAIFQSNNKDNFKTIKEKVKDYDELTPESKSLIESGDFDLYLVDLRLNGLEEDLEENMKPQDFSGTNIIKKIKTLNPGNQVIMFTASNKAWNMKHLVSSLGVGGYYIKESPEYNFSSEFSRENFLNFKEDVDNCLRLHFLRNIAIVNEKCMQHIALKFSNVSASYQDFYTRTKTSIQVAFELLQNTTENPKYFSFAFLTYHQILEDYCNQQENITKDNLGVYVIKNNILIQVIHTSRTSQTWELSLRQSPSGYKYFENAPSRQDRRQKATSLALISFILSFKFNHGNLELNDWGRLNNLRNTEAAHGGNTSNISISDIQSIIKIVEMFIYN